MKLSHNGGNRRIVGFSLVVLSCLYFVPQTQAKVIYGNDDRMDLYQVQDPALLKLADSTAALFRTNKITLDGRGNASLSTRSYAQEFNLCQNEPFFDQNSGAFCSGSLVGPDLLLTAGHCVRSATDCQGISFVFGFGIHTEGMDLTSVPADEVYGCKELVKQVYEPGGLDFSLVRLNRTVTGHEPLKINRSGQIPVGTPLVVIGHPSGLPTKVAGGAIVRTVTAQSHFVANLDTYGGNSGSAVFNSETGEIEGVLVRGERDFRVRSGEGCMESNRCSDTGCRGEDVTKASTFAAFVPQP